MRDSYLNDIDITPEEVKKKFAHLFVKSKLCDIAPPISADIRIFKPRGKGLHLTIEIRITPELFPVKKLKMKRKILNHHFVLDSEELCAMALYFLGKRQDYYSMVVSFSFNDRKYSMSETHYAKREVIKFVKKFLLTVFDMV